MDTDDIVYISLLCFTIIFGHFFRQLTNNSSKKWISTSIGFVLVLFVSGIHIIHPIICIIVNAVIILCTPKRSCHIASFVFSFLYLLFFRTSIYFNIPYAPGHTNLVQMMFTLKLVGLAFEAHDSYVLDQKEAHLAPKVTSSGRTRVDPSLADIIHYSFCYVGVLTGPYYTYKTYDDFYTYDLGRWANCGAATLHKLKMVPIYATIFLLLSHYFPLKYMDTDEFYNETTLFSRLVYMNAIFTTFRMRIYIGLLLSESACTMAGLGAYPSITKTRPGMGPTTRPELVPELASDAKSCEAQSFDFETIHNINPFSAEFDVSFRNTVKNWNMCIQYWLAFVVYKRFPSKAFRTAAVFAISAFWHGVYIGYYFCLFAPPFYLPIEDIWEKIARRDDIKNDFVRKIVNFVFWFVRTEAFAFMGIAFSLLHTDKVLRFYRSIYFMFHIGCIVALVAGLLILRTMPRRKTAAAGDASEGKKKE